MAVELRADPWRPDFGAGAEAPFEDEMTRAVVDPTVETADWSRPVTPDPCPPLSFAFVDGVMRTEMRVMATDGDRRAWGLLGSYAAGAVACNGRAEFAAEDEPVRRALLLGGRISSTPMRLTVGRARIEYECCEVADDSPTGLRRALQRRMLDLEGQLSTLLAGEHLVFADGPLHFEGTPEAPVVGVVKRMVTAYLEGEHAALLPALRPRERTPIFGLGNTVQDRFAWYLRLIAPSPTWHDLAGLVRCEVKMNVGRDRAIQIANVVACHLPTYAGRPGVDPRAPQNLTPVGALEARLKHRLGSSTLLARAIQAHLAGGD